MPLKAYEEFATEQLAFPIGGKVYTVPRMPFNDGVKLTALLAGTEEATDNEALWRLCLGSVFDDMKADQVPAEAFARAGFAALADFRYGREWAEKVWEFGLDPKALAAAIAATIPQPQTPSSSTGTGNATRSRASSSGTRSPRKRAAQSKGGKSRS